MACLRPVSTDSVESKGQKSIIEIYTDWANHYLDKTKGKRRISNLQAELSDGLVLCEVIEAVTQQRIPDMNKKPRTHTAMVTNIQTCLNFLRAKGVAVDDIAPEDVREGNLKAILGLFFQLSRYKQQQKQLGGRGSVPSSPAKTSSIPVPGSCLSPKRDAKKAGDVAGNRSFLPAKSNSVAKPGEKSGKLGDRPGIKPPTGKHGKTGLNTGGINTNTYDSNPQSKQSMLERLKVGRTSQIPGSSIKPGLGKRTSSSSGFSSARSDRSESSVSLSSDTNFPSPSALRRIQENQEIIQADQARRPPIKNKLSRAQASKDKSCSPKRSPKLTRGSVTELKDYGSIDEGRGGSKPENYPPHAYSRSNSGISFKHTNITSSPRRDEPNPRQHIPTSQPSGQLPGTPRRDEPSPRQLIPTNLTSGQLPGTPRRDEPNPRLHIPTNLASGQLPGTPRRDETSTRHHTPTINLQSQPKPSLKTGSGIPAPGVRLVSNQTKPPGGNQPEVQGKPPGPGKPPPTPPVRTISIAKEPIQEITANNIQEPDPGGSDESERTGVSQESPSHKTSTLPRQRRRGDMSPSPNVAIVSPMPSSARSERSTKDEDLKKDEAEDALQGIAPMAPLGMFRGRESRTSRDTHSPNTTPGDPGYVSDSDVGRRRGKPDSGYISEGGADYLTRGRGKVEDGYASEGGAEIYAKRFEQRAAYERQREEAELRHKQYLEMAGSKHQPLPQVLGRQGAAQWNQGPEQVYKVVGGRRNVQKSDSGMQTDVDSLNAGKMAANASKMSAGRHGKLVLSGLEEKEQWRAAMERSKRVLTSQEQAMEEYLRRQRKEAEKHIKNSPMLGRRRMAEMKTIPGRHQGGIVSMPGTPTGSRRSVTRHKVVQDQGERGGSLERQARHKLSLQEPRAVYEAASDSEYIQANFRSGSPKENSRSLPKGTSALNYGLLMGQIQQKRQQRNKNDGSVSDSNYATYSELGMRGGPYQWLQPANTYSGWTNPEEMGSSESINSISSSIKNARSLSLTKANVYAHQKEAQIRVPPKSLTRLSKPEETEYYGVPFLLRNDQAGSRFNSQPSSPLHEQKTILQDLGTPPLKYSSLPSYSSSGKQKHKNNLGDTPESLNGSNLSLVSNGSSVYSTQEEKTNADIAKLQQELMDEQRKVFSLTSQLNTNAHVVSAFEQSLANMTSRLQQITHTAERKDAELGELRRTMDVLRQSGVDAGLIATKYQDKGPNELMRQMSTDSVGSMSSAHSNSSLNSPDEKERRKKSCEGPKRSGWLRNSFSKAFSRSKLKGKGGSVSDCDDGSITRMSEYTRQDYDNFAPGTQDQDVPDCIKVAKSSSDVREGGEDEVKPEIVGELKRQLLEKDTLLTETRLEALSSAHQLESLKETVTKMKTELLNLRQDNEKFHTHSVTKSLGSSEGSLNTSNDPEMERRLSLAMSDTSVQSGPSNLDLSGTTDPNNSDSKLVSILVQLSETESKEAVKVGTIAASGMLSWELLDSLVERLFKEFIIRVDPVTNLGLGSESIQYYEVGEVSRCANLPNPELLPYGYLVGEVNSIVIVLKNSMTSGGVDALAFETLTPKSILQRYVSLLQEHRRVILSGPSATGKSYVAAKLSNFLVKTCFKGKSPRVENFSVERGNIDMFKHFLRRINLEAERKSDNLPQVVILDNLQFAPELDSILSEYLRVGPSSGPFIIGTMVQTSGAASSTSLQLKHSFRWILCANHIEPVRGFLGRYLKRRLVGVEAETRVHNADCARVVEWISRSFLSINKFLESHCSPESTLSPGLFLSCPMEPAESRLWFINLWNLSIVPHILDSVREGLQMYGRRASWEDPLRTILDTWPWPAQDEDILVHIHPEDVGFDVSQAARPVSGHSVDNIGMEDPLFNMLMTLQEAANTESGDL